MTDTIRNHDTQHTNRFSLRQILTKHFFSNQQTTTEYLTFAAISKLIAAAATYPYQVIRTRLQDANHTYKGTWVKFKIIML
jgi:hypothetical protein